MKWSIIIAKDDVSGMLRPAAGDEPEPWEDVMIANNISPCIATDDSIYLIKNIKYFIVEKTGGMAP